MAMSIEEAIGLLERGSQYNYYDSAEDFCKAYDMAIETMRKYQTIEQIRHRVEYTGLEPAKAYELINEVIEHGNVD